MVLIAPSTTSIDFTKLGEEIKAIDKAGADFVHIDVMDGHFVPNFTFGHFIVKQMRPLTALTFDVHLMVTEPLKMVPWFVDAGADIITVHFESEGFEDALKLIRKHGKKAGISLKPDTKPEELIPYFSMIDLILVMTVEPGFGGQGFMDNQLIKVRKIKDLITDYDIKLEVDGGINAKNAPKVIAAGADIMVAGTAVFGTKDYAKNIEILKHGE